MELQESVGILCGFVALCEKKSVSKEFVLRLSKGKGEKRRI
jgi:hypothetical protein